MNGRKDVIEVKGFGGLLTFIFCICCFVTGFAVLPGSIIMFCWNFLNKFFANLPVMNIWHGIILWLALFLIYIALFGKKFKGVHVALDQNITEDDLKRAILNEKSETTSEYEDKEGDEK